MTTAQTHHSAPGEPAELAALPPEVRHLVHVVDRMRDQWAEAETAERAGLWTAVHEANDNVWHRDTSMSRVH